MGRQQLPAPGNAAVRSALDAARLRLSQVGEWLKSAAAGKKSVAPGTLKNYRDGRREMPPAMRKLLANQLRKHARRLEKAAEALERTVRG
jgi:hypothetical protein